MRKLTWRAAAAAGTVLATMTIASEVGGRTDQNQSGTSQTSQTDAVRQVAGMFKGTHDLAGVAAASAEAQPTLSQLPQTERAIEDAPPELRFVGSNTRDPVGVPIAAAIGRAASRFQLFVTGASIDATIGIAGVPPSSLPEPGLDFRFAGYRPRRTSTAAIVAGAAQGTGMARGLTSGDRPVVQLIATGASSGDAFRLEVLGGAGLSGRVLAPDGLVLEALTTSAPLPTDGGSKGVVQRLPAFCAEFAKDPPPAGTVYRVADARQQERLRPMRHLVRTAEQLAREGRLRFDSDPAEYLTFVKQWTIWTRAERWDLGKFGDQFLARTKKNFAELKRPWTRQIEEQVRALVPGRWGDIQAVIRAAGATGGP